MKDRQLIKQEEKLEPKGIVKIRSYKAGSFALIAPIMDKARALLREHKKFEAMAMAQKAFDILKGNQIGEEIVSHNLVMTGANTGRDLIIQALNGFLVAPVYYSAINYGAIGTNNTAPAAADTQLGTETARTPVSWSQDVGFNQLQLQFFFSDGSLTNTTYYEFGTFVVGTATPNSGKIFNHVLFSSPYVKTSGIDTTIELDISL
jgi:hypothetical protein